MQREFLDEVLRRLATEPDSVAPGWEPAEIRHLRLLVQCAHAAVLATDMLNMRQLRLLPSLGDGANAWTVRLSARHTLTLRFKTDNTPMAVVFEISSPETGAPR